MTRQNYLMESEEETLRLDMKTEGEIVKEQALWAGIKPGMRVADLGFGSGKTTFHLHQLIEPEGEIIGVDISQDRIEYANKHYLKNGIQYICRDIQKPMEDLGLFDFIYVRFVLEYHRTNSFQIVKNISKILKPGGILNILDLDNNCLCHYGLSERLEKTLFNMMHLLQNHADFDPYVGRKLFSFFYDLGFENIDVKLTPHHLIYGNLNEVDDFNWGKKAQVALKQLSYEFDGYPGGYDEFYDEFQDFFSNPRRFTYTPLISCRGQKPLS